MPLSQKEIEETAALASRLASEGTSAAQINATLRLTLAGQADPQTARIAQTSDAAIRKITAQAESRTGTAEATRLIRQQTAQDVFGLEQQKIGAQSTTVARQLRQLESFGLDILDKQGGRAAGGDAFKGVIADIKKLDPQLIPRAPQAAFSLQTLGDEQFQNSLRTEARRISTLAQRKGVVLEADKLQTLSALAVDDPTKSNQIKQAIREQARESVFARKASGVRAQARSKGVLTTIEDLIPTGPGEGVESFNALKTIRKTDIPRAVKGKGSLLRRVGGLAKKHPIAAAGSLGLAAILASMFGGKKEDNASGLTDDQKFRLALAAASNTGRGRGGPTESLETGRTLGNIQKLLSIMALLRQADDTMLQPQSQLAGGFV